MPGPFRADHVGSLLRPRELHALRDEVRQGKGSPERLREAEDRAIREVVSLQEELGLPSITDGEFRRDWWRSGGFEPLRHIPQGKRVVLGLVSSKVPALEDRDVLKRRIRQAAKIVPLENLCLSPQCGFSSTHHGNNLTVDEQKAKLRLCLDTAREVWGSL